LRIRARSLVTQDVILDRELVTNAVKASGMQCLSSSSAGHLDVLLVTPPRRTDSRAALERVTAAIHRAVSESTPLDVAITAGDPVADLADVAHSFWQAQQVMLSVGQGRSTRELFSTYDDVDVQGLMRLLKDDRRVQEFVERRLGRIMQSPAGDRQQLLRTLAVYLEQGGNKSTTSELLKINRSTLYQRLRRLSKLLRCDLQSPVHRTALAVALAGLRAVREDFPGNDTV
jgi:purine catabolism regulator